MIRHFLGRVTRPALTFVACMLLAQATVSIAANPAAPLTSVTYTRVTSCAGMNFHPINSATNYIFIDPMLSRWNDEGDGWFLCDPHLPNKAVVTKVRFTVFDDLDRINIVYCGLVRTSLGTGSGGAQAMAVVNATGMSATPGTVRPSTSAISNATIDEASFAYWLQCQIIFGTGLNNTAGHNGIIGADVTYRISSTNG
jgi:hypothetical protein